MVALDDVVKFFDQSDGFFVGEVERHNFADMVMAAGTFTSAWCRRSGAKDKS